MTKPWVLHDAARAEVAEATTWYEAEAEIGADFLDAVDAALAELERDPTVSSPMPDGPAGVRRVLLDPFPYAIVFVERPTEFLVVAIAHQHRRPGYWKRRLPT
jgi:toxin ParE1/3/4